MGVKDYLESTQPCHPIMHPRARLGRGDRRKIIRPGPKVQPHCTMLHPVQLRCVRPPKCASKRLLSVKLTCSRLATQNGSLHSTLHDVDHPQRASWAPGQGSAIPKLTEANRRIVLCFSVMARRVSSQVIGSQIPYYLLNQSYPYVGYPTAGLNLTS